jgi:hypothetical protein
MHATYENDLGYTDNVPSPLLKWSAVFGGLVLGLAMLLLLSTLWLALAYGSEVGTVRDNLGWFMGASAVVSLFVAAILTGYLSGVRGAGPGLLHGLTLWGLLMLLSVTVGIPALLNVFGLNALATGATTVDTLSSRGSDGTLWVTFWTLIGGFVAAGLGGMIGASFTRAEPGAVNVVQPSVPPPARREVRTEPARTTPPRTDDTVIVEEDDRSRL